MEDPAAGGTPVQVTTPDHEKGESGHFWPRFLPDGRHVLFTLFGGKGLADAKVGVVDLQTARVQALFPGLARDVRLDRATSSTSIWAAITRVPFDAATLTVTGAARPVLEEARPLDPLADRRKLRRRRPRRTTRWTCPARASRAGAIRAPGLDRPAWRHRAIAVRRQPGTIGALARPAPRGGEPVCGR